MKNWWKSPILRDDDKYDYMMNELPKDTAGWSLSKYKYRCDSCGNDSRLRFASEHYFYTLDGYDSLSHAECWKCILRSFVSCKVRRVKKKAKALHNAIKMRRGNIVPQWNFKQYYDFAKELQK